MHDLIKRAGLAAALAAALATVLVLNCKTGMIERYFIYFPDRKITTDPSAYGLPYADVSFVASDGVKLHGWFVPGAGEVTWLWFHGNAGNISHRLENLRLLHEQLEVNVFLFDYRGYGASEGRPSEEGTYLDAEAALGYLHSRSDIAPERIVYFGRSMGAAMAVELALRSPPLGLILESPFPSIPYMARRIYPFLPVRFFLRTRYDSLSKVASLHVPTLVLHGDRDDVVPIDGAREIFEAVGGPKQFHVIEGAGHNDTYLVGGQAYFDALRNFVEGLAGDGPQADGG